MRRRNRRRPADVTLTWPEQVRGSLASPKAVEESKVAKVKNADLFYLVGQSTDETSGEDPVPRLAWIAGGFGTNWRALADPRPSLLCIPQSPAPCPMVASPPDQEPSLGAADRQEPGEYVQQEEHQGDLERYAKQANNLPIVVHVGPDAKRQSSMHT